MHGGCLGVLQVGGRGAPPDGPRLGRRSSHRMPAVGQGAQVSEFFPALDWLTALTAHIPASLPLAWHFLSAVYTPVIWTPRRAE